MFECPFCGGRSESFLPFGLTSPVLRERTVVGGGYRSNAVCPSCLSLDRERLVYLFLLHRTDLFASEARVLHVAPEGNLSETLSRRKVYVAADLMPLDGMIRIDITHIELPDAAFDVVICNHVLEHVPNDRAAMSEIFRVLRPAGWAILQVPFSTSAEATYEDDMVTDPADRDRVFGQSDHVRVYGQDYPDRLRRAGFSVEIRNAAVEFGDALCERYALCKAENVYLCRKTARA
jgi:SAM-dependent methyltransferase